MPRQWRRCGTQAGRGMGLRFVNGEPSYRSTRSHQSKQEESPHATHDTKIAFVVDQLHYTMHAVAYVAACDSFAIIGRLYRMSLALQLTPAKN